MITPIKEAEIHEGRKRIDIKYTNSGTGPFFGRILQAAQTRAIGVSVECKNYSTDPENPELDQLSSRFSHARGFFGFMCCRTLQNRALITARCRDTARDGRGFVLVLDDEEVRQMLNMVETGDRNQIEIRLNQSLNELLT